MTANMGRSNGCTPAGIAADLRWLRPGVLGHPLPAPAAPPLHLPICSGQHTGEAVHESMSRITFRLWLC